MPIVDPSIAAGSDWLGLEHAVARLCVHMGWSGVNHSAKTGDKGGDVLACPPTNDGGSFLFQVKSTATTSPVGVAAVQQALDGQMFYGSRACVAVTNSHFTRSAHQWCHELREKGVDARLWDRRFLQLLLESLPEMPSGQRSELDSHAEALQRLGGRMDATVRRSVIGVQPNGRRGDLVARIAMQALADGSRTVAIIVAERTDVFIMAQKVWALLPKSVSTIIGTRVAKAGSTGGFVAPCVAVCCHADWVGGQPGIANLAADCIVLDNVEINPARYHLDEIEAAAFRYVIAVCASDPRASADICSFFGEPVACVTQQPRSRRSEDANHRDIQVIDVVSRSQAADWNAEMSANYLRFAAGRSAAITVTGRIPYVMDLRRPVRIRVDVSPRSKQLLTELLDDGLLSNQALEHSALPDGMVD